MLSFLGLRSIQSKMTALFLLLTLLAMQVIGAGLLYHLRGYYIDSLRQELAGAAEVVAAQARAALAGGESVEQLRPLLEEALQPPANGAMLLGPTGRVLFSSGLPTAATTSSLRLRGLLAQAEVGRTATALVRTGSGETQVWAAVPVRHGGRIAALVLVESSAAQVYAIILHVRSILLTWTLVALVLSGLLSILLARTVTGPIEALTQRARAMAAGDFAGRLPVHSRDEVGQLALMFNHLARRLQETLDQIRGEQRRAQAILTNMTDGLLALDAEGRVLLCNPAASAMLDLDLAAVHGRPALQVLPASLAAALTPALGGLPVPDPAPGQGAHNPGVGARPVALPEAAAEQPWEALAPSGAAAYPPAQPLVTVGQRHLRMHVAPLLENGATTRAGTVVVLQDVTTQERLELMRKEFVANVSHDLRTPVTTIQLYAETLLEWGLTDPELARPKLQVIVEETQRMGRLVGDLLELSEMDVRGAVRQWETVDLAQLCRRVAARLEEEARQKGIVLAVQCPAEPVWARADGARIERVVANLLSNALEFTPSGGAVQVAVARPAAGWAEVAVRDTGIGIPAGELQRIFERFYRGDPARTRAHGGSGLGLAIAKEIVEAHGGWIRAESPGPGGGATLRFALPAAGGETP